MTDGEYTIQADEFTIVSGNGVTETLVSDTASGFEVSFSYDLDIDDGLGDDDSAEVDADITNLKIEAIRNGGYPASIPAQDFIALWVEHNCQIILDEILEDLSADGVI